MLLAGRDRLVGRDRILQLSANRQDRVERVHGALHHDRVVTPADFAKRLLIHRQQVAPLKAHAAGNHPRRRAEQAGDREQKRRFSTARLADDADELAGRHVERDLVDGADRAGIRRVFDREIFDLEHRPGGDHRVLRTGRSAGFVISSKA